MLGYLPPGTFHKSGSPVFRVSFSKTPLMVVNNDCNSELFSKIKEFIKPCEKSRIKRIVRSSRNVEAAYVHRNPDHIHSQALEIGK